MERKSMKLLPALLIGIFLSSNLIPFTALAQTEKARHVAAQRRSRRRIKRRCPCKPAAPAPPSLAITTASGLTYAITHHGQGRQPLAGETVVVNYTGLLGNGKKFDSSLDRGQPFSFKLGVGQVIKGWDEGIGKLHVGDQATLIIPPQLGYGARGAGGVIPPDATLIFIVELLDVKEAPTPR
jgi:FKBP-type peptidyl-prolyl cis-trans isomerase